MSSKAPRLVAQAAYGWGAVQTQFSNQRTWHSARACSSAHRRALVRLLFRSQCKALSLSATICLGRRVEKYCFLHPPTCLRVVASLVVAERGAFEGVRRGWRTSSERSGRAPEVVSALVLQQRAGAKGLCLLITHSVVICFTLFRSNCELRWITIS